MFNKEGMNIMKVIAHRGYSGQYPENTMLAYEKAVEAGCDEIEIDVQMTKDGVLVMLHDENVENITNGRGYIKDLTYKELRQFNVDAKFGDKFGFNPIPSLEEYLDWVRKQEVTTNIELKNRKYYYPGLEEKTLELIKKYRLTDRVMFSSFNHVSLLKCKQIAPSIECGILVGKPEIWNAGYFAREYQLECYHPDIISLTKETVDNCKENGIKVNVWTINGMDELQKMYFWGCDGAITNYPDICKAWLGKTSCKEHI
jgi:glycerophosphoryl diester phosphodiesterase